jgi:hypothetical protein
MKTQDFYGTTQGAWRRTLARIAATGAVAALAACQTNVAHERQTGTVLGRVRTTAAGNAPIVVLAFDRGGGEIAHRALLGSHTAFSMRLYAGSYRFYACADENQDGHCGNSEPRSVMYSLTNEVHAREVIQMPTFSLGHREAVAALR